MNETQKPKNVQIRADLKELSRVQEMKMRAAGVKVLAGEIPHYRQMDRVELGKNVSEQVLELFEATPETALEKAANVANYAMFLAHAIIAGKE